MVLEAFLNNNNQYIKTMKNISSGILILGIIFLACIPAGITAYRRSRRKAIAHCFSMRNRIHHSAKVGDPNALKKFIAISEKTDQFSILPDQIGEFGNFYALSKMALESFGIAFATSVKKHDDLPLCKLREDLKSVLDKMSLEREKFSQRFENIIS